MSTNPSEQLTVLCRDDFVILPPGSEDARQQLCSFNLTTLWMGLAPHSNLVYLVSKVCIYSAHLSIGFCWVKKGQMHCVQEIYIPCHNSLDLQAPDQC